jgi:glycosyltransferase involved in cell wall biosynthesis
VRFWGHRADVQQFYQAADIFIQPSMYEAFSLAALEAAASGVPLILTASSGAPKALVGDGEGGRVVTRDPAAVADALHELGGDRRLRRRLGRRAQSRVASFSWERSAETTWELYQSVLHGEA